VLQGPGRASRGTSKVSPIRRLRGDP
jgi:hypothetical protein